jgi:predicted YcjX-like family ATPase
MFTEIFELSSTAEFHLAQPLAEARTDYLAHCAKQGFRAVALRKKAQFLLDALDRLWFTLTRTQTLAA